MKQFKTPQESLGDIDAETVATLIATTADIALIVDRDGVIRDISFSSEQLSVEVDSKWLGQRWVQTVTVESRAKVEMLLREAALQAPPKWRQVNHPSSHGADVPVRYCAVQLGADGRVVAFGNNLQAIAILQQRLVDAQQSIERDYWSLRQLETRYRLLFQMTSEAILLVDASTQSVVEANPTASQLLGETPKGMVGRVFPQGFNGESTHAVQALLDTVRVVGQGDAAHARLAHGTQEFLVSAFLLRQENTSLFAIRLTPLQAEAIASVLPEGKSKILKTVEGAPDAVVVTDSQGLILTVNAAFVNLAQLATERQARGASLERWLGRPGVDLNVLIANLREHGSVRLFATTLRGDFGAIADVEISAVSVRNGERPYFGFIIRNVSRRVTADSDVDRRVPRSVEQLTELVGRVPLREIVRQSTDVIERLCVEAALEVTGENRASAAELLGLSRQSLYVKLRRYGLRNLVSGHEN